MCRRVMTRLSGFVRTWKPIFEPGWSSLVSETNLLLSFLGNLVGVQRKTLYVTNGGEFAGNGLVNGGVVSLSLAEATSC